MTEKIKNNHIPVADDEIDLIALAKTIWDGRKTIITTVLLFMLIGLGVALLSPKEYTASTTIVPQNLNKNFRLGSLSSLAAMAGVNLDLNMETRELSPYIYPQIVQSDPFQLEIMNTPFIFSDVDKPVSLYEYYTNYSKPGVISLVKKYTLGLPGVIIGAIRGAIGGKKEETPDSIAGKIIQLTAEKEGIRNLIAQNVTLETNDKEGYIVLNTRFHEPRLAAEVAQKGQELLQKYITKFKIEKASAQLLFIQERYAEKKTEFYQSQTNLAAFLDRNKNVTSAMARTEEARLQYEYKLAFEIYSQLSQQLEQARIKVKEDTPVFAIVKPVKVPMEKSKPNRPMIFVIWTFLGGVIGIGWIFGKQFFQTIKTKWNEEPAKQI
jgi:LPS O-antigen subunit length determinant protein (WzzB/FepE family)